MTTPPSQTQGEMLPCPFCQEPGRLITKQNVDVVICSSPYCSTNGPVSNTQENAIKRWNRRSADLAESRGSLPFAETVEYILQYGSDCRDCADHDGTCYDEGKIPCDYKLKKGMAEHAVNAIVYGIQNGYLKALPLPPSERNGDE